MTDLSISAEWVGLVLAGAVALLVIIGVILAFLIGIRHLWCDLRSGK